VNYKRGFLRIWLVASCFWFVFSIFYAINDITNRKVLLLRANISADTSWDSYDFGMLGLSIGIVGIGGPLFVLLLSVTIFKITRWILTGFRSN
jgi:hypothetical protein